MNEALQVIRGVRRELAAVGGEVTTATRILGTADALLERVGIEMMRSELRLAASQGIERLWSLDGQADLVLDDVLDFERRVCEAEVGSAAAVARRDAVLSALVASDLADVELRASSQGAGDPSVNSLGGLEVASVASDDLQRYLRSRRTGGARQLTVNDVVRLAGGFSKETILASVTGLNGDDDVTEDIVLRKVVPGRPADNLPMEHAMMSFAWRHGLPAPEPLWIELDHEPLGSPFFVTRRMPGRNSGDVYGPNVGVDADAGLEVARIMAAMHALDVSDLGETPVVPMVDRRDVLAAIHQQGALLTSIDPDPDGHFVRLWRGVLAWLRSHAPADLERPVLVHADVGFHNLLLSNGHISALLDWERSHLGPIEQDLAYFRPSVEPILPWEAFIEEYRRAGGPAPDPDRLRFYTVWQDTWRGIASLRLRRRFLDDPERLSDAVAGMLMAPTFLRSALHSAFETFDSPEVFGALAGSEPLEPLDSFESLKSTESFGAPR